MKIFKQNILYLDVEIIMIRAPTSQLGIWIRLVQSIHTNRF